MSNQNAGADKRACKVAWLKTIVYWAENLPAVGDQCLRNEIRHFADAAKQLREELRVLECDCADCTRQHSTGWKTWRDAV
jgi:hypothetical protein